MDKTEAVHIFISVVTISLAFSMAFNDNPNNLFGGFLNLPTVFVTIGLGFVLHEMAHKFVATRFGCIAVYRAWIPGLVIAIAFALMTAGRFVFAAPGAVYIYKKNLTRFEDGIISLAGPVMNFIIALFFLLIVRTPATASLAMIGFSVNMFLGFFNMIPIPPLDGSKVIRWNMGIWLIMFGLFAYFTFLFPQM